MKIRQPGVIKAVAFVLAAVMRLWMSTLRVRSRMTAPWLNPLDPMKRRRHIYAFWHETLLLPTYVYGHAVCALISQHADGELVTRICAHLRVRAVRGSTTRGAVQALRKMLKMGKQMHLAVSPDGPHGPRRRVQPGIIYLASRTGLPIVPSGFAFERPWRMRTWDRFALPKPWSRAACVFTEPILVPPDADRGELERYRQLVEDALNRAMEAAERLAGERQTPEAGEKAAKMPPAA